MGVFPATWQIVEGAIEMMLNGQGTSQETLDVAAK